MEVAGENPHEEEESKVEAAERTASPASPTPPDQLFADIDELLVESDEEQEGCDAHAELVGSYEEQEGGDAQTATSNPATSMICLGSPIGEKELIMEVIKEVAPALKEVKRTKAPDDEGEQSRKKSSMGGEVNAVESILASLTPPDQLFADIEDLLVDSDEEQEEQAQAPSQAGVEKSVKGGLALWRASCAKTSLSFAQSNILEGQEKLIKHPCFDHLTPRVDRIINKMRLVIEDLNKMIEDLNA